MVVSHALSTIVKTNWIVDSGATSHMCNDESLFSEIKPLLKSQAVQVGDGHSVEAKGEGTVELKITLSTGVSCCKLSNVLYVPDLSYNLLSVSKAAKSGKVIEFHGNGCNIINKNSKIIAAATKIGDLYFLNCINDDTAYTVQNNKFDSRSKMVTLWHRRFGHLGENNLKNLLKNNLVTGLDFDIHDNLDFCEPCVQGKQHKTAFPKSEAKRATKLLELIHTDVCGKIEEKSLSGKEYFLSFIDDKSRYTWIYNLKKKSEVFEKFLEWKNLVERYV